jgi:magnesium transporter
VTNWHDIRDPKSEALDELAARYGLHPLHIEDVRHRGQNAKIEPQDNYLFIVLKPLEMDEDCLITPTDLDVFLGPDFLITVQESKCQTAGDILDRVRASAVGARPDQIFYRVLDGVVDSYNPILDRLSDEIDKLEDDAVKCPETEMLEQLFDVRRALIQMRRILANTRDVLGHIQRSAYPQIGGDMGPFLRDVYDHVARNMDLVEIHRDLLTGAMELYLSGVANRTNQIMKVLTVFGTIATPALVITGMYGMNLPRLPFADHPHSWGIVMTLIGVVSAVMLIVLRRLRWL